MIQIKIVIMNDYQISQSLKIKKEINLIIFSLHFYYHIHFLLHVLYYPVASFYTCDSLLNNKQVENHKSDRKCKAVGMMLFSICLTFGEIHQAQGSSKIPDSSLKFNHSEFF